MFIDPPGDQSDPQHWLDRAAERRALAETEARTIMLRLADDITSSPPTGATFGEQRCTLMLPHGGTGTTTYHRRSALVSCPQLPIAG
jgi:hypothetical protein